MMWGTLGLKFVFEVSGAMHLLGEGGKSNASCTWYFLTITFSLVASIRPPPLTGFVASCHVTPCTALLGRGGEAFDFHGSNITARLSQHGDTFMKHRYCTDEGS